MTLVRVAHDEEEADDSTGGDSKATDAEYDNTGLHHRAGKSSASGADAAPADSNIQDID